LLITADHGNVEKMIDENGNPHTAHTTNRVPFILIDNSGSEKKTDIKLRENGCLADVAPTILDIMEIEKPQEMTGKSLIEKSQEKSFSLIAMFKNIYSHIF